MAARPFFAWFGGIHQLSLIPIPFANFYKTMQVKK